MQGNIERQLEEILKESYLTYAMSVIVSRALPDVKDGLKPVHRRILYSMYELGNTHDKPYKKSARVVGEVLGKYHPHGDAAIYDSLVRMAQYFSLRYLLVDGQGNFGSIDGDSPAAMRYTEVRMTKLAEEMLSDLEMETVDFRNNFDNTLQEPVVLPSKIPQLLINGSSGIAVGMATNIPPHNLGEIIDALLAMINKEGNVYDIVKGPDFPTGGIILGKGGIASAYRTGKGIIKIRSKAEIKDDKILITEIPYQVSKTRIIEEIVLAVKDNKIEDIADLHDRSDKSGLLIELKLKKNASAEIVLNKLFEFTSLEVSYGIINLALVNGVPKVMNLEEMLSEFLKFRFEVIRKRIIFLRKKAEERRHILFGLLKAISKLDETVNLIRKSKDVEHAISSLKELLEIDDIQAKAILDMKLQKLISVEREKLNREKDELDKNITYYDEVLSKDEKVYEIITAELLEIKSKYADKRKTEIMESYDDRDLEDLIPDEECFVAYSEEGYIKRVSGEELKVQGRGGKGIQLQGSDKILSAKTHDTLLIFTNTGRVYGAKIYEIPDSSRYAKGRPIQALVKLSPDEKVFSLLPLRDFSEGALIFATRHGIVKRTKADLYSNIRKTGINAVVLKDTDSLVNVYLTNGNDKIVLVSESGHSIMFEEQQIRESGRVSQGVRGMKLRPNSKVVSFSILRDQMMLFLTSKGFGKLTQIEEFKVQKRGGKGVICIKTSEKTGKLFSVLSVQKEDEIVISTKKGKSVRVAIKDISEQGRYAKGVRVIKLEEGDSIASCAVV